MMRRLGAVMIVATSVISACATSGAGVAAGPPAAPVQPAADTALPASVNPDSVRDAFVQRGLRSRGSSRTEIMDLLGEPDSTTARAVANRHDPAQTDTIIQLFYADLVAQVYHVTGARDLVQSITVSDNRHLTGSFALIGAPWEDVLRYLGPPSWSSAGLHEYICASCPGAENPVRIRVRDGVVAAIEFGYYVD